MQPLVLTHIPFQWGETNLIAQQQFRRCALYILNDHQILALLTIIYQPHPSLLLQLLVNPEEPLNLADILEHRWIRRLVKLYNISGAPGIA